MKRILFIFSFVAISAFSVLGQSYISAAGNMKVDASLREFSSPNIYVIGTYDPQSQTWRTVMRFVDGTSFENVGFEYTVIFTKAEVDAFTGSGTGDTEKAQNALEQTVVDFLEAINGPIFTIN